MKLHLHRSLCLAVDLTVRWIFQYDVEEYYWAEPSFVARRAQKDKKRAERGKKVADFSTPKPNE